MSRSTGDEGSVFRRKSDNLWVAQIDVNKKNGERRRVTRAAKTKALAQVKLRELRAEKERTYGDIPKSITTGEWLDTWYAQIASKKSRPSTLSGYRSSMEQYIKPTIGHIPLRKLSPTHIRKIEQFITVDKGLSSTTAHLAHRVLSVALKHAEREGLVGRNPATLMDAPVKQSTPLEVLSLEEGIKVLDTLARDNDRLASRWASALLTGARQGELLGLELDRVGNLLDLSWQLQRIPWEHGCGPVVSVETYTRADGKIGTRKHYPCKQLVSSDCPARKITAPANWERRYITGGLWWSRPKSKAGWRIIPLVDPLRSILEVRIATIAKEPNPFGLVWTSDPKLNRANRAELPLDGSPIDPSTDSAAWHALLARAGVTDVRLHDARHTAVDLLYEAGVDEAMIGEIVGHSTVTQTRSYRSRRNIPQLTAAMLKLSGLIEAGRDGESPPSTSQ